MYRVRDPKLTYLSHELELLYDFFEVVVGRQRVDLVAHVVHELLPGDDRVVGRLFPPLRQRREDELEEASRSRKGLRGEETSKWVRLARRGLYLFRI